MRSFAPTGHRHTAEILQVLSRTGVRPAVHLSATAVDNISGVLATAHVFVKPGVEEKDLFKAYRQTYRDEPFVRIVKARRALPLPRTQNFVGQQLRRCRVRTGPSDRAGGGDGAIDNLMKGAARGGASAGNESSVRLGRDGRIDLCRAAPSVARRLQGQQPS